MVSTAYLVLALHYHDLIKYLNKRHKKLGYFIFFPYRGVEGNFLNSFLGLKKKEIQGGGTKNHPYETNFLGMTPLENLPQLALTVITPLENLSWPPGRQVLVFDSLALGKYFWRTPSEFAFHTPVWIKKWNSPCRLRLPL